jgi:hypothetical protein
MIIKYLELSTAHIPIPYSSILHKDFPLPIQETEYGWRVFCIDDPDVEFPVWFLPIAVLCRDLDIPEVLFDSDGPICDELPTWDW